MPNSSPVCTHHEFTTIDYAVLPAFDHKDVEAARAYAIERTNRIQGECRVLVNGKAIATYKNGEEIYSRTRNQ